VGDPRAISSDEVKPYWEGAARGVLMIKRCTDTGKCFHYPRERSPFTGGPSEWVEASGLGTVYSCSFASRPAPQCLAYVQLDEGPIMLTHIVTDDLSAVAVGQKVTVAFREFGERTLPVFVPAG
jgi:uncharacterized OB-fold protein